MGSPRWTCRSVAALAYDSPRAVVVEGVVAPRRVVWITGASSGIGQALTRSVPFDETKVIGVSRHGLGDRPPTSSAVMDFEGLTADLSTSDGWDAMAHSFHEHVSADLQLAVFIHAAAMVGPLGFAGEVDTVEYRRAVLLNTVAPQVLGDAFIKAVTAADTPGRLVMLTSGMSPYPGWTAYKSGKAAVNAWVEATGAEQGAQGTCRIVAVAPGYVDTDMQEAIRAADPEVFPSRDKFIEVHQTGKIRSPDEVAPEIWAMALRNDLANGAVVDL